MTFIPAGEIVVGDAIVEADGYLLAVLEITRTGKTVTMRLASDFSPMGAWRSTGAGIKFTKRCATKVAVVKGAGWTVCPEVLPRPELA